MLKRLTLSLIVISTSAFAIPAIACDFHGAGAGYNSYRIPGAEWKPYNPRVYTEDPTLFDQDTGEAVLITPRPKERPSFSNAANRAATLAKSRMARKVKTQDDKASKEQNLVKKTALNADR